jgi:hypothetical protein
MVISKYLDVKKSLLYNNTNISELKLIEGQYSNGKKIRLLEILYDVRKFNC